MINSIKMVYESIPGVVSQINSYIEIHISTDIIGSFRHKKIYTVLDIMRIMNNPFSPKDLVSLDVYEEDYIKVLGNDIIVFGKRIKNNHKKKLLDCSTVFKIYDDYFERIEPWITMKYL